MNFTNIHFNNMASFVDGAKASGYMLTILKAFVNFCYKIINFEIRFTSTGKPITSERERISSLPAHKKHLRHLQKQRPQI